MPSSTENFNEMLKALSMVEDASDASPALLKRQVKN